jgi:hypothetical protein
LLTPISRTASGRDRADAPGESAEGVTCWSLTFTS